MIITKRRKVNVFCCEVSDSRLVALSHSMVLACLNIYQWMPYQSTTALKIPDLLDP